MGYIFLRYKCSRLYRIYIKVFRSLQSVLGVSKSCNFEMNSITIPRKPGEAVGAICQLEKDDHKMSLNVEYNQI